jgi:gamma-glutamylcyclotransferase (GGCT)/AIG2-like uncharacterized protein YtfP
LTEALFAYGTLSLPELLHALAGRPLARRDAELEGFVARRLRGQPYPGLVPAKGARTRGALYLGIDPRTREILDRFEGEMYERRPVRVTPAEGAVALAFTYLLRPPFYHFLTDEPWDPERFASSHLPRWLEACRALRAEVLGRQGG